MAYTDLVDVLNSFLAWLEGWAVRFFLLSAAVIVVGVLVSWFKAGKFRR